MYHPQLTSNKQDFKATMHGSRKWLDRLEKLIRAIPGPTLMNNEYMAKKLDISERDLFRKVKLATGLSPQKYLRQYRLKQAMRFLQEGKYRTVKETARAVGYSNIGYFILQFEKEYGKKPLQVLKEQGWR